MRVAFTFCLLTLAIVAAKADEIATPESVLRNMLRAYENLTTYSDSGVQTMVHNYAPDDKPYRAQLRNWFARPHYFRFELLRSPGQRVVAWSDGETHRVWDFAWNGSPGVVDSVPLGKVMWATEQYDIPSLLDQRLGGPLRLHQLSSRVMLPNELIEGVDCFHLRGTLRGDYYEVWIATSDRLIRKIKHWWHQCIFEEFHHDIKVDAEIPIETFYFQPPEGAKWR